VEAIEALQIVTLGFVGFVWVEIREIRKLLADARERLAAVEQLNEEG
jgi:hypothetical protein